MKYTWLLLLIPGFMACKKGSDDNNNPAPQPVPETMAFSSLKVNGVFNGFTYRGVNRTPALRFSFSAPLNRNTVGNSISIKDKSGAVVAYTTSYENNDSTVVVQPSTPLSPITPYTVTASTNLKSVKDGPLQSAITVKLYTAIDSLDKFSRISENALLDKVQQQTFKYFWDFAHPVSGLARERNTSGDVVTTGGSGFGIMAILVGIHRQFITRGEGLARLQKIVDFLKNKAQRFHGAYPHWLHGSTGAVQPFSTKDNGADLVETAFLMQGLLTARQYFNGADAAETALRNDINTLWEAVEWSWFRKNGENVLYWHWSPNYGWEMNHPIRGWNETLITYVLAASSPTHTISKEVYDNGFAQNGSMRNGNSYYGLPLPLGPPIGGPLFFAHYSFLGLNPSGLSDAYANYWDQNRNHALIHHNYSKTNPKSYYGYSDRNWGLTASDDPYVGYLAHEPGNDNGVIAPTAALSSFPYTPTESMKALEFFYYVLGDKLWKEYGFVDAFTLHEPWFADSYLAIDQGPIIIMIENYRSGLLWNLFMSSPEVKAGLKKLGFTSPHL